MPATRDPQRVRRLDDERLRRFLDARRAGDAAGARRWWDELLTENFDRVSGMVALQGRGRLSREEREDALQHALMRIAARMIDTFRGTSMGEWVLATRRLVEFACIDTQRRATVRSRREQSFGRGHDDDGDAPDAAVYAAIEERRREDEALEDDDDALREGREFLDWAVPRLSAGGRAVIELDREGVPVQEIQRRLGVSRDVVYARRSRALKELAKLHEEGRT